MYICLLVCFCCTPRADGLGTQVFSLHRNGVAPCQAGPPADKEGYCQMNGALGLDMTAEFIIPNIQCQGACVLQWVGADTGSLLLTAGSVLHVHLLLLNAFACQNDCTHTADHITYTMHLSATRTVALPWECGYASLHAHHAS
jgi:hypothetical protein